MLEVTNDAVLCKGRGVGVRNQVKGKERMWDWLVERGGQEVLQEPVGFTFASVPQTEGQSLWLLTSVASVSLAGK